jgi:phage major head subunit gpT-like protein
MLQSQQYGRLLEPGLRKIFLETYSEVPEQYSKVFNIQNSTKAIETDLRIGGFGLFEKKDSAGSVQYQDPAGTQSLQYIHEEFASGFTVERKLVDDEQYNQIGKFSAALGRAARATIETRAADVLNTAFTTNGFDGVPLISATHKNLDGSTQSNQLVADALTGATANGQLSDKNLKAALVQMRAQKDDKGILIQTMPKILVVPPQLEYIAKTILQSSNLSAQGSGSGMTNDVNVLQSRLQVVVMDYFTYTASAGKYPWLLIDPTVAQLNFFWRKKLEFGNEQDFSTMQYKYRAYMRFSVGYSDFRGVFGSTGVGAA